MAAGATIHTFTITLADVDREVYEELTLRAARHPSETDAFMVTRVLALCLEYTEGIAFSEGISAADEPAVLVRDATGAITAWIEVGAPDAARLHTGSLRSPRVVVYTQRDPTRLIASWAGKRIHRAEHVRVYGFAPGFIEAAAALVSRRTAMSLAVTERQLYLDIDGTVLTSALHEHSIG